MPFEHEANFAATFTYGISTRPIELPAEGTSGGHAHFRSVQLLTEHEAAGQLVEKLREKSAEAAAMHNIFLQTLSSGLAKLQASGSPILALPGVSAAVESTTTIVRAVMAVPAAPAVEMPDIGQAYGIRPQLHALELQVATLARTSAALAARVAALEAAAAPAAAIVAYPQPHLAQLRSLAGIGGGEAS